jgi:hypothetical protein
LIPAARKACSRWSISPRDRRKSSDFAIIEHLPAT